MSTVISLGVLDSTLYFQSTELYRGSGYTESNSILLMPSILNILTITSFEQN